MLKSKMRLESVVGGEMLLEARGDLGEGEGVGDLEARLRLEHLGDNMAARNEGDSDLGLSRELDMDTSYDELHNVDTIIPVLVSRGIAAETSKRSLEKTFQGKFWFWSEKSECIYLPQV